MRKPNAPMQRLLRQSSLAALLATACAAGAQNTNALTSGIYTCVDDEGRKLTADRPIPQCMGKEQRVLNRDGSLRMVQPPTLTAEERAEKEARERRAEAVRAAHADAVRRDRNLISRYPSEAQHLRAREAALDTVRMAIKATDQRQRDLDRERRPLLEEAEFYKGKALPAKLKQQLDANDASVDAQRSAASNQEAELDRINRLFDNELSRLRQLWAGAAPGSLGPLLRSQAGASPLKLK